MKIRTVPSVWLEQEGRRLDSGPYLSGAIEARVKLEGARLPKVPLRCLTKGHDGGIYNGPQFSRNYVASPTFGVPFLTSGSMLRADLSNLPLLRRKDAESPQLRFLQLTPGMILVSCSGTVGRMSFSRPDMADVWSSQDVLKVVVDEQKAPPGYVYSFLAGRYGVPLVVGGTYGSVIQHLEPSHIRDRAIPRLAEDLEIRAHQLVQDAARELGRHQEQVRAATRRLFESVGLEDITRGSWHNGNSDVGFIRKLESAGSLRALNFNPRFLQLCDAIRARSHRPLAELCKPGTLHRGGRYRRIDADPEYSYRLIGQKEIFWLRPEGRWIARKSVGNDVLVEPGTTLIAAQGTLGESELYCRAEFVWGPALQAAYSEHLLRVVSDESLMPRGCLFAFMRSETAFRMLRSISMGTKLQDHHPEYLRALPVPYPDKRAREEIHELVVDAYEKRHASVRLEDEAVALVERAIEEGA